MPTSSRSPAHITRRRASKRASSCASIEDFGHTCLVAEDVCVHATESTDFAAYQPLARDTLIDAPVAYVAFHDVVRALDVKLGRQTQWDALGFVRFDGGFARMTPSAWIAAEAEGGALVTSTSVAGTDAFVPQGSPRLDLGNVDPARASFVGSPQTIWFGGAALEVGPRTLRLRASFREMHDDDGLVERRGALALSVTPTRAVRASATGVWDFWSQDSIDATALVTADVDAVTLEARAERHVPRFDPGTIWAYFTAAPISEARLGGTLHVGEDGEDGEVGVGAHVRHAELTSAPDDEDFGGDAHASWRMLGLRWYASSFAWQGDLGPLAGGSLATRTFFGRLDINLTAGGWYYDDPLRQGMRGLTWAESAGAQYRLTDQTTLSADFEHATSDAAGQRFRVLLALAFEVWR